MQSADATAPLSEKAIVIRLWCVGFRTLESGGLQGTPRDTSKRLFVDGMRVEVSACSSHTSLSKRAPSTTRHFFFRI